ncbi:MAG: TVP38/TMEM64 family protein [Candidatus Woesearchaeota archaeon]|jgi:uncharacterized membrane protein YdjX (TVP38/TMEM64 family)|nr:TVP38/TMEM64 family protein [Candidatus Woesearchaeota archaeon]
MPKEKNRKILKFVIAVIILVSLSILLWEPLISLLSNTQKFKELILGYGMFSPLILIVFVILQVLIAPIPGQAIGLASGYIFGTALGTTYSMIGLIIGSYIAFVLSRRYGRPFVEKVVDKKILNKFDELCMKGGIFTIFLIFLFPATPDDAICFIAGLTNIRIRTLVIVSAIGRLPGFLILNLMGDGIAAHNYETSLLLFALLIIVSAVLFVYRKQIEKAVVKIFKKDHLSR